MKDPLVSICIPTYNGERYLRKCLDSAISQSYCNIEILIVDDKSSDATLSIVNEYASRDDRFRVFSNEINLGLVRNWNRCIELAKGEWVKFLFQDDLIAYNMIERMMQFASEDNKFIVSNREILFEDDTSEEIRNLYKTSINVNLSSIFSMFNPGYIGPKSVSRKIIKWRWSNYIGEPTVILFNRAIVSEIGYFNSMLVQICDLEYWYRVATIFGIFYIPETLASFRVHHEAMSSVNRKDSRDLVDSVVILYELSYGKNFLMFRNSINWYQLYFLRQLLKRQIHRLTIHFKRNEDIEEYYGRILKANPGLKKIQNLKISYFLFIPLILIRRLLSKV
jgi:glycosyltransferase involved in cell wall biosynthesis